MALWVGGAFAFVTFVVQLPDGVSAVAPALGVAALKGAVFGVVMTLAIWLVLLPLRVSILHRQNPALYGPMNLKADDEAVEIVGPRTSSRFAWSDFRGFLEDDRVFVLCLSKSAGFTVPKDHIPPPVAAELRAILAHHLKQGR